MNWIHFLLGLAGIYSLYYLVVVMIDLAAAKRSPVTHAVTNELSFSETPAPVKLDDVVPAPAPARMIAPEMIGSGGVVIDNLFKLCKQEAVVYTRSVSF